MSPAPSDPASSIASLAAGVTALAGNLYELDTLPELALAKAPDRLTGKSAAVAREAALATAVLWERYPLVQEAVSALQVAVAAGDRLEVERLLGSAAIRLPDGSSTGPHALLTALEAEMARARAAAGRLASAWRDVVPRLDGAAAALRAAAADAADLGLDEPEVRAAQGLVQELAALAATDPLTVDPAPAERAVARARERLDALAGQRSTLPDDLRAAAATLAQLERLIQDGRDTHALAASRIDAPGGLAAPLDHDTLDHDALDRDALDRGGPPALRPWLARLESQAGAGSWVAAATGLAQWREAAARLQQQAEAVVAANRAPLARRNDLRGLLEAYRAKAAASGHAEDPSLTRLYSLARDALYAGPCDLDAADGRVQDYLAAVNRAGSLR